MAQGDIRIGIAGWVFEPWRGEFYPAGLPQKQELGHASRRLRIIELNATFYANQKLTSFTSWEGQVPAGFMFSVKGPKLITHQLRLKNAETPLANFLASGLLRFGPKLGPLVWQLPPNLHFDPARIEAFLALLPQTPEAAGALAAAHDARIGAPFVDAAAVPRIRHAMEARHESYANPEFVDLLRRYNVALVAADTADWPWRDITADFVYARLQGPPQGGGYDAAGLDRIAGELTAWSAGSTDHGPLLAPPAARAPRDVHAFFVHEDKLHAPRNAEAIMQRLDIAAPADA